MIKIFAYSYLVVRIILAHSCFERESGSALKSSFFECLFALCQFLVAFYRTRESDQLSLPAIRLNRFLLDSITEIYSHQFIATSGGFTENEYSFTPLLRELWNNIKVIAYATLIYGLYFRLYFWGYFFLHSCLPHRSLLLTCSNKNLSSLSWLGHVVSLQPAPGSIHPCVPFLSKCPVTLLPALTFCNTSFAVRSCVHLHCFPHFPFVPLSSSKVSLYKTVMRLL